MMNDAVIVGGGVVGALAALRLVERYERVLLVEQRPLKAIQEASFSRSLALNHKSMQFLGAMGLWHACLPWVCPVKQVDISMQGQVTVSRLKAQSFDCDALGYVISQHHLERILYQALEQRGIQVDEQTQLQHMKRTDTGWDLTLQKNQHSYKVEARFCLGADGQHSKVRSELGIGFDSQEHHQAVWVGVIDLRFDHLNKAYEHFTSEGAVALLPMQNQQATFIWTMPSLQAQSLKDVSTDVFVAKLLETMPKLEAHFANLRVRLCVPLTEVRAQQQVAENAVLLGNAAHSLHPIAAQGLNLSLRDLKVLMDHLHQETTLQAALYAYEQARQGDQKLILSFTRLLSQQVASSQWPMWVKHAGLALFEVLSPLKNHITRMNLGAMT